MLFCTLSSRPSFFRKIFLISNQYILVIKRTNKREKQKLKIFFKRMKILKEIVYFNIILTPAPLDPQNFYP